MSTERSLSAPEPMETEAAAMTHSQSEPSLALQEEDDELDATDTSRDEEDDDDRSKPQDDHVAAHLDELQRSNSHLEEVSRAASCSSLSTSSGAGSASSAASLARRSMSNARLNNPLKGDTNLKIFLPSDSVALKAILSPQNSRSPSSKEDEADSKAEDGSSANLLDKLLFRGAQPSTPKKSMGSMAEEDLEAMNVVVMNTNLPPPPFANMYACESCREDIGSLLTGKGRHHCRNCGGSFCADCTQQSIIVPYQAYLSRGELRVCDGCYYRIKNFQKQVKSTSVTWSGLQPPSSDELTHDFQLAEDEAPVSIFNCALFLETTPYYGHLVLTRKRLCFQSYADDKKLKVAYSQVISLLKPQFYYINGLQVKTKSKETLFLAEFNGLRDTCFLRLDQLIRAYQEASKLTSPATGKSPSSKELRKQALDRRRTSKLIAEHTASTGSAPRSSNPPVSGNTLSNLASNSSGTSTVGYIDVEEGDDADVPLSDIVEGGRETDDGKSTASDEEPFEPLPPDPMLDKMTVLLDCDLRADVKRVFDLLWNDGPGQEFLHGNMEKARDIGIEIESWRAIDKGDDEVRRGFEISKEDDYTLVRRVRMQHPPKISFPGLPPYAHCTRTQRFRLDKSSQGGDKWDRFVVSELNRMTKIPFSDYFEVESRYVFTRDGNNYCHVQVGLVVNFLKATWFKSQINSSTRSESKEALEAWAKQAIEFLEAQRNRVVPLSPTIKALSAAGSFSEIESVASSAPSIRKRAASAARATAQAESPPVASASVSTSFKSVTALAQAPGSLIQWLLLGLLLYGLMLLRGHQHQMQQLTVATTKLLEHLEEQQSMMQAQVWRAQQSCEGSSVAAAMHTLQQFVDAADVD